MLTAVNESGRRFSLQGEERLETLKKLRDKHRFYCEACGKPLILKLGQKVAWHFAHKPNMSCHGENEPESIVHLEGKRALYHWLNAQGEFPILEKYIPDIKQRADLFLHHHPKAIAIEYQCSNLTPQRFMERTAGYLSLDIRPIWILGENRLKNYGLYLSMALDRRTSLKSERKAICALFQCHVQPIYHSSSFLAARFVNGCR